MFQYYRICYYYSRQENFQCPNSNDFENLRTCDSEFEDPDKISNVGSPDTDVPVHMEKRPKSSADSISRPSTPVSQSSTPSSSMKAKLLRNFEERSNQRLQMLTQLTQQKEEDDVDLFMRSVAMMVKKLPPNLVNQAKLQILTLVSNLQESVTSSNNIQAQNMQTISITNDIVGNTTTTSQLSYCNL